MITFILLGFFVLLAIGFAVVAWGANNRKRAGMKGTPTQPTMTSSGDQATMRH